MTTQAVRDGLALEDGTKPASHPSLLQSFRNDDGATLVEIAVTLPIFFLLVFGLINFALVMFGFCNISYASRAAARYACLHSATSSPDTTVAQATTTANTATTISTLVGRFIYAYPSNTYSSSLTYSGSGNQVGNTATVTVTITYNLSMPLFTYNGLTLKSTATGVIIQ